METIRTTGLQDYGSEMMSSFPNIAINLLLIAVCYVSHAIAQDAGSRSIGKLEVYPERIDVSPDYPARLSVGWRTEAGHWIDLSEEVLAQLSHSQVESSLGDSTLGNSSSGDASSSVHGKGILRNDWVRTRFSDPDLVAFDHEGAMIPNIGVPKAGIQGDAAIPNEARIARLWIEVNKDHSDASHETKEVEIRLEPNRITPRFEVEVAAVLSRSGCNLGTCHGNLHGKGGFRLSLRGDDTWQDFSAIMQDANGRRVDRFHPDRSLLLRKPTGKLAHQGGLRIAENSLAFQWIERWIGEGGKWDASHGSPSHSPDLSPSPIRSLEVFPAEAWIEASNRRQPLTVIATFNDGARRDVTAWARMESSDLSRIAISPQGVVEASGPIEATISISYLQVRCASRLVFLASEPSVERRSWSSQNDPSSSSDREGPRNQIDRLVQSRLHRMQLACEPKADQYVLLRRLFLVTVGRLPTLAEVKAWEAEDSGDRVAHWVERLLADPGYDYLWALHWSDVLRNEPKVMSRKGAGLLNEWLRHQSAIDRPLNEMVEELVSSTGSTYENPPASFHRTHRDPSIAAESIGQVFLGVRLQCARCHNHPFDRWKQDDYYGLAAYFTTIERKQIDNAPADGLDTHVITGDEIISLADRPAKILHPGRSRDIVPTALSKIDAEHIDAGHNGSANLEPASSGPESNGVQGNEPNSPLRNLGRWLTQNNRQFARNMANRIWFHYWGKGIVDPPDDFRDSNPASNPELLEYLTDELIRSGYSARHLARLILTSESFASGSLSQELPTDRLPSLPVFGGYGIRRIPAEVMLDAISDSTGVPHRFGKMKSESKVEESPADLLEASMQRAIASPPMPRGGGFLKAFGKPDRTLICECERSPDASLIQSLLMLNGDDVRSKISDSQNRIAGLVELPNGEVLEELFLATLTRHPSQTELSSLSKYLAESSNRRSGIEDVLWTLLNSKEFALLR